MEPILVFDRETGKKEKEEVFGGAALELVYGDTWFARIVGQKFFLLLVRTSFFAWIYGMWQRMPWSKRKVQPFIDTFKVDTTEFRDPVESFKSFNSFFIRHLRPEVRPIAPEPTVAVVPADGRFRFIQNVKECDGFLVKGQCFNIDQLVADKQLSRDYVGGSMVMGRLCPTDYHRYHFPCDCIPSTSRLINGWLYSVNPIATRKRIGIFTENKRTLTRLETKHFGRVLYMEIGATCVGSINQTYVPQGIYGKGDEKGYFAFGASAVIILFQPGKITFDSDLLNASQGFLEVKCRMGQSMGSAIKL